MSDITATTSVDRIQVWPNGKIEIFEMIAYSNGGQAWNRRDLLPGDDVSAETNTQAKAIAIALWTDAVVSAYKASNGAST
jgi:hypothetical protein